MCFVFHDWAFDDVYIYKNVKNLIDVSSPSSNSPLKEKHENSNAIVNHMTNIHLKSIRIRNLIKIVIGHLNINSLRNKFDFLVTQVKGYIDILKISETKLDERFPIGQFLIDGYRVPFRLDRNENGGGILLYVRDDIPSKQQLRSGNQNNVLIAFVKHICKI